MENAERIYNLISKQISGELSDPEQAELNAWLEESSDNRNILEQFKKVWHLTQPNKSKAFKKSVDEEYQRLRKQLQLDTSNIIILSKKSRWTRYLSAAAVLIAVITTTFWFSGNNNNIYTIAETKNAETKELRLSDGTYIQMNNATQIKYRIMDSDSIRLVILNGEAFFNVKTNEKPFIVQTEIGRVRVLGTKFNVWSRKTKTRVHVREGKVSLTTTGDSSPQEKAVINANQLAIAKDSPIGNVIEIQDSDRLPGWLEGRIVFNRTELDEVAEELERIYDRKIRLEQDELGSLSITANFRKKPVEDILEAVCMALDLNYRTETNGFIISK
jgi:transmembrane sensor